MTGRFCFMDCAIALGTALTMLITGFAGFSLRCDNLRDEVLRLHILANSDSDYDQQIKYGLRDRMLTEFSDVFGKCDDINSAIESAKTHKQEMEQAARKYLNEMGADYSVTCEIAETYFTTRSYDDVILPAGNYTAVRFLIGEGKGRNWWCVMFPPLCLPACGTFFSPEQSKKTEQGRFEIRFALFEWITSWFK